MNPKPKPPEYDPEVSQASQDSGQFTGSLPITIEEEWTEYKSLVEGSDPAPYVHTNRDELMEESTTAVRSR